MTAKELARKDKLVMTVVEAFVDRNAGPPQLNFFELIDALNPTLKINPAFQLGKRVFDILISLAVILFGLPFFLLIAAAIKLESRGPVLFRQERLRQGLVKFSILKFRTMYENVVSVPVAVFDSTTNTYRRPKSLEDARVTNVGRILRRFSLDELPQFINILLGDMSLVGPRPLTVPESIAIPATAIVRYSVPSGLTGLAQIRHRDSVIDSSRFDSDLEYIQNLSLKQECAILFLTFGKMHHRE